MNESKLIYPRFTDDLESSIRLNNFNIKNPLETLSDLPLTGVCISACPSQGDVVCLYNGQEALDRVLIADHATKKSEGVSYCGRDENRNKPDW